MLSGWQSEPDRLSKRNLAVGLLSGCCRASKAGPGNAFCTKIRQRHILHQHLYIRFIVVILYRIQYPRFVTFCNKVLHVVAMIDPPASPTITVLPRFSTGSKSSCRKRICAYLTTVALSKHLSTHLSCQCMGRDLLCCGCASGSDSQCQVTARVEVAGRRPGRRRPAVSPSPTPRAESEAR